MMSVLEFDGIDKALSDGLFLRVLNGGNVLRMRTARLDTKEIYSDETFKTMSYEARTRIALWTVSRNYLDGKVYNKIPYGCTNEGVENNIDCWVQRGNELFAKKINKNIRFEAIKENGEIVLAAECPTFTKAYLGLCKMISRKDLDNANYYNFPFIKDS